jgi:hypothetical protein
MEQIKSMEYSFLVAAAANPDAAHQLPTKLDDTTPDPLTNGQSNQKTITIDVDSTGHVIKTMKLTVTPTITDISKLNTSLTNNTTMTAMEILITYQWTAPESKVPYTRAIRAVRSYIPTY